MSSRRIKRSVAMGAVIVVIIFLIVFSSQQASHFHCFTKSLNTEFESILQSRSSEVIPTADLPNTSVLVQEVLAKRLLLVLIITTVEHQKKRDMIRKTWAGGYDEKVKKSFDVRFVMGTLLANETQQNMLTAENKEHNDLVLLADHLDIYNNLTRKTLQTFIWVDQNVQQYEYVLKIDDDTFARLDVMVAELKKRVNSKGLYWGHIVSTYKPHKGGKWKEDRWFLCSNYIPYALGGAYILSSDVIHHIALSANLLTLYNSEDVSVGTWVAPLDIERHHDPRFSIGMTNMVQCRNSNIAVHCPDHSVDTIQQLHEQMVTTGVMCPPK